MAKRHTLPSLLCLLALSTGCASDLSHRISVAPNQPVGRCVLEIDRPADLVSVRVNGKIVAEDVTTERIVLESVPVGVIKVVLTGHVRPLMVSGSIEAGQTTRRALELPEDFNPESVFASTTNVVLVSLGILAVGILTYEEPLWILKLFR